MLLLSKNGLISWPSAAMLLRAREAIVESKVSYVLKLKQSNHGEQIQ